MKIAYITRFSIYQPFIGGGTVIRFLDFARELRKKHHVLWISTTSSFKKKHVKLSKNFTEIFIRSYQNRILVIRMLGAFLTFLGLIKLFKDEKFDILICHHPTLAEGLPSVLASRLLSFPVLMDYLDYETLGFIPRVIQNWILKESNAIMTISKPLEKLINRFFRGKMVFYVPHPVFPSFNKIRVKQDEKKAIMSRYSLDGYYLVGYQGSLLKNQGVHDLITAFKIADLRGAKLIIVGGAPLEFQSYEKDLHSLVKRLELENDVLFTGYLTDARLIPKFISIFDLGVIPKIDNVFNKMCFPTKAVQYILMSVPTLGTRIGLIPSLLLHGEGGYICEPSSPRDLAEKIQVAFNHREDARKKAKNALESVLVKYRFEFVFSRLLNAIYVTYRG